MLSSFNIQPVWFVNKAKNVKKDSPIGRYGEQARGVYYIFFQYFFRWRLQKALFSPTSVGRCGCAGISYRDCFLTCPTFKDAEPLNNDPDRPLTLKDLDNVKPILISNSVINRWRRTTSPREPDYEVLSMSPHGIERLDRPSDQQEFEGKLMPEDIYLSDAMATSAAAVDHHMGALEGGEELFKDLKVTLGIAMGTSLIGNPRQERKESKFLQVL